MTLTRSSRIDKFIFAGIISLLVFAPLAFGSVHVWAYSLVEIGVFSLLLLWVVNGLIASREETLAWAKTPLNLFAVLLLAFIGLQLTPLPPVLAALVSPGTVADKGPGRNPPHPQPGGQGGPANQPTGGVCAAGGREIV